MGPSESQREEYIFQDRNRGLPLRQARQQPVVIAIVEAGKSRDEPVRVRGQALALIEGIADYHRMLDLHVPPLKDIDEMLQKIKERVNQTRAGDWILGAGGWGQPMPTRQQLDLVAPNHPVIVRESAHEIVVNSKALELAHIEKDTPDPQGSKIWRDSKTGEPTGRLSEMFGRMLSLMPKRSFDLREQGVREVLKGFVGNGVTTVYDFPSPDGLRIYQDLLAKGELPLRLRCQLILNIAHDRDSDTTFDEDFLKYGLYTGFGNDWLRIGGVKLFIDGESQTGLRYDPPGQNDKWVEVQKITQETLNRFHRRFASEIAQGRAEFETSLRQFTDEIASLEGAETIYWERYLLSVVRVTRIKVSKSSVVARVEVIPRVTGKKEDRWRVGCSWPKCHAEALSMDFPMRRRQLEDLLCPPGDR